MQEGLQLGKGGCTHHHASGENAFFCTACGHQLKQLHGGKVACRAAEGSAEVAWKAFGFSGAPASGGLEPARLARPRNISARRAASQAFAATSSTIQKDAAPPTSAQAKVIGVESVVEGVAWDLSSEQLQIMALARSGALRNRRRSCSNAAEQGWTAVATNNKADNRTAAGTKRKGSVVRRAPRNNNRRNLDRHISSGDKSGIGNNFGKADRGTRPSPNAASDGHSGYEPSKSASVLREEVETAQNEVSCARTPVAQKVLRREGGTTETQEQAIAMARGGVRYSGVVFHRKGVKLTQDSPRSMLPRDAFRSSERNLLCTTEVSLGPNGGRRYVVALSVITPSPTPDPAPGGCGTGASPGPIPGHHGAPQHGLLCLDSQATTGMHPAHREMYRGGVRLDVRHADGPDLAHDPKNTAVVASEAVPSSTGSSILAGSPESGAAKVDRTDYHQSAAAVGRVEQNADSSESCATKFCRVEQNTISRESGATKVGRAEQSTVSSRETSAANVGRADSHETGAAKIDRVEQSMANFRESGATKVGSVEQSTVGAHDGRDNASCIAPDSSSSGGDTRHALEDQPGAEGNAARACPPGEGTAKGRPSHADTLPESEGPRGVALHVETLPEREGLRGRVDKRCHYPAQDGGCRRRQRVVFSLDLTHSEVDAFLRPAVLWKDPFQENTSTVRELESGWTAALLSLCKRLHTNLPARGQRAAPLARVISTTTTDNGRRRGGGQEGERGSTEIADGRAEEPCPTQLEPGGKVRGKRLGECSEVAMGVNKPGEGDALEPMATVSCATETTIRLKNEAGLRITGQDTLKAMATGAVSAAATVHPRKDLASPRSTDDDAGCEASRLQAARHGLAGFKSEAQGGVWFDNALLQVGARVPWGRRHRGRFAKVLFTVCLGKGCRGLDFSAMSFSPTGDPMLRGRWECQATDSDLARYLSPECGTSSGVTRRRVSPYEFNPKKCTFELQQRGELRWACTVLAQKAFRLVLTVPGGVILKLAGTAVAGGREIPWPQDVELDRVLAEASVELQRACRGWISRKRTRWVRMEREGRRRLSRLQKEVEAERESSRVLETQRKVLHERYQSVATGGPRRSTLKSLRRFDELCSICFVGHRVLPSRPQRHWLSRSPKETEAEREKVVSFLETQQKFPHERRTLAQIVLASTARRRAATKVVSQRRAAWKERQRRLDQSAEEISAAKDSSAGHAQDTHETVLSKKAVSSPRGDAPIVDTVNVVDIVEVVDVSDTADKADTKADNTTSTAGGFIVTPATPGVVSLERAVTIDGTEVQLTAQVRELNDSGIERGEGGMSVEMSLVAFDNKTRRSSRLQLEATDIASIVGTGGGADIKGGGGGGGGSKAGALEIFSTVLKSLTVFNSRRKDLFILSYRGKKIAAPH